MLHLHSIILSKSRLLLHILILSPSAELMEPYSFAHDCLLPLRVAFVFEHIRQAAHFVPIHEVVALDLAPLELLLQISLQHFVPQCLLTDLLQLQVVAFVFLAVGHSDLLH